MTYNLRGTWSEVTGGFFDNALHAEEQPVAIDIMVRQAMVALVATTSVRVRGEVGAEDVAQFLRDSSAVLGRLSKLAHFDIWVSRTLRLAEQAEDDDWYGLCVYRSAVQVLLDDYAGTPVAQLVEAVLAEEAGCFLEERVESGLPHFDDELRRVGLEQGPLPTHLVIPMPASHWWWRYPATPNGPSPA